MGQVFPKIIGEYKYNDNKWAGKAASWAQEAVAQQLHRWIAFLNAVYEGCSEIIETFCLTSLKYLINLWKNSLHGGAEFP
jgi:hypothetical protein